MDVEPPVHYVLTDHRLNKEYHKDYNSECVNNIYKLIKLENV